MKHLPTYIFLSFLTLLIGCKEETKKPKVIYENNSKTSSVKANANTIPLADLPILMEGTSVLLHPVGELSISEAGNNRLESSSYKKDRNFLVSNSSEYEITGFLSNIKFQQIGTDSLTTLTDKPVIIERITYLKNFADKSKKQLLVYVLEDLDSNKDGKLDSDDIKNLYISDINGTGFTKLSADFQELIDWNIIEAQNRLYFRTIEDINKNGAFDKDDKVHYHFVNLISKDWKVQEYNPI